MELMMCDSFRDFSGQRFGCWIVQNEYKASSNGERKWLCHCGCGTDWNVLERGLLYGGSNNATLHVDFFPLLKESS